MNEDDMSEDQAVAIFGALSNNTRLRVLKTLVQAGPSGLTAGEIASAVDAAPSRASFHLSAMTDTGLLSSTRSARQVIYTVDFAAVASIVQYLLQDCCANDPRVLNCCGPSDLEQSAGSKCSGGRSSGSKSLNGKSSGSKS